MEKIAVIELKTTSVKLQIVDIIRNKYYQVHKTIEMPINLTKDFYSDYFVKPSVIKQLNGILAVYKKIVEKYECTESVCLATDFLNEAKNIFYSLKEENYAILTKLDIQLDIFNEIYKMLEVRIK